MGALFAQTWTQDSNQAVNSAVVPPEDRSAMREGGSVTLEEAKSYGKPEEKGVDEANSRVAGR